MISQKYLSIPSCLIASVLFTCSASARLWKNPEGTRAIEGEFASIDGKDIVLKTPTGKELRFALSFLSKADQELAQKLASDAAAKKALESTEGINIFTKFEFGENQKAIEAKVKTIKELKGGVAEALRGRVGLSGAYFVELDGMRYDLHFNFDQNDRLTELSLQSDPFDPGDYDTSLKAAWNRLRSSFVSRYGEPPENRQNGFPKRSVITEGAAMSSDLWQVGDRHLYLGTGMIEGKVSCVLRCSNKTYVPEDSE